GQHARVTIDVERGALARWNAANPSEVPPSDWKRWGSGSMNHHWFVVAPSADMRWGGHSMSNSWSQHDNSTNVQTGPITIHTQATDASGIVKGLREAMVRHSFAVQANTGLA